MAYVGQQIRKAVEPLEEVVREHRDRLRTTTEQIAVLFNALAQVRLSVHVAQSLSDDAMLKDKLDELMENMDAAISTAVQTFASVYGYVPPTDADLQTTLVSYRNGGTGHIPPQNFDNIVEHMVARQRLSSQETVRSIIEEDWEEFDDRDRPRRSAAPANSGRRGRR